MTNSRTRGRTNRNKGNASERAAAKWLTEHGWPAKTTRNVERGAGRQSVHGDLMIADAPHVVIDVKDRAVPRVYDWLDQLETEADDRPCRALIWKPFAKGPDPAMWLAVVADHPLDWFQTEISPRRFLRYWERDLDTPGLRSVLGWLDVEHAQDEYRAPALVHIGHDHREWLLMRAETFVAEVLPCWEADPSGATRRESA